MPSRKAVVICFGRMNPPTTGHAKLLDFMKSVGARNQADVIAFVSTTQDPKKNPLPFNVKVNFLKMLFPKVKFNENASVKTPLDAMQACSKLGYRDVYLVVGSDRVASMEALGRYVKPKSDKSFDKSKDVDLDDFEVVAVPGERDPDADEDVAGVSASKQRKLAAAGDFKKFAEGVPTTNINLAQKLYAQVRAFMGIKDGK